jgi:ribosome-binding protein aMBF1 (putative translation factor)
MFNQEKKLVDAIEDGRIVRVSEEYALSEGLLILRKHEVLPSGKPETKEQMKLTPRLKGERKAFFDIDKYRRPWHDKNEILSSLADNFNWIVSHRRKQLNLNRKQLAQAINVNEEDIKMIENGIIPHNDYILVNKLESYMKINLRKDAPAGVQESVEVFKQRAHAPKWADRIEKAKAGAKAEDLVASDIEIVDSE